MTNDHVGESARERRKLGEDLEVGRLGLGAMQLPGPGVWGPPVDHEEALGVLRTARDLGVTHIDSSDAYGPHVSNDLIREALHPYPPDLVISTKVGVIRDQSQAFVAADRPQQLRDQAEANLRRLGLNELDLVYLRVGGDGLLAPGPTPFIEAWGALSNLKSEGMTRSPTEHRPLMRRRVRTQTGERLSVRRGASAPLTSPTTIRSGRMASVIYMF